MTLPARKQRSWRTWLFRGLIALAILFLATVFLQRRVLFYNWGPAIPFAPTRAVSVEEVTIDTADGETLHGYWAACPAEIPSAIDGERPVVLFFHGNSGAVERWRGFCARWQDTLGADVLLFDYRGYGKSTGAPSESGIYDDARAAYRWLTKSKAVDPKRIIIVGQSLGGGPACYLATNVEHRMLILESTFTSVPDIVNDLYFGSPVGWFCVDCFPNEKRLKSYGKPLFISHGTADLLISVRHAHRLKASTKGTVEFLPLDGMGHHDQRPDHYREAVRKFVRRHWERAVAGS